MRPRLRAHNSSYECELFIGGRKMTLNAPKKNVWLVSVIVGVLGLVGFFVAIPFVSTYAFWFVTVGFALLALSTMLKGM